MSGPPRTPREIKRQRGTLRPDRDPQPLVILPPADTSSREQPGTLGDEGARIWKLAITQAPWLANSDIPTLRLLAEAMDRRGELIAHLANDGYVLYTDKGYAYLNPAQGALATTEAQITKWFSLLGLTPADRSKLGVAEVKARTKLEELRDRRERKEAGRPAG
jgi:P27 family predicted phage terminase small subunit